MAHKRSSFLLFVGFFLGVPLCLFIAVSGSIGVFLAPDVANAAQEIENNQVTHDKGFVVDPADSMAKYALDTSDLRECDLSSTTVRVLGEPFPALHGPLEVEYVKIVDVGTTDGNVVPFEQCNGATHLFVRSEQLIKVN